MKYDILNSKEEIALCNERINEKEKQCKEFSLSIRRGRKTDLLYNNFHKYLSLYRAMIFDRYNIGQHAKVLSERTTGMYSGYRFYHIFKHMIRLNPKTVYEYGCGSSTAFIGEVLRFIDYEKSERLKKKQTIWDKLFGISRYFLKPKRGEKRKLISFEQNPKYYDLVQSNFPEELRKYVEIKLVPLKYKKYGDYRGLSYNVEEYPSSVDLAYIDGPTRTRGDENTQKFWIMSDIIDLINNGCDLKFALTDHRYTNYIAYKDLIGDRYDISFVKKYRSIEIHKK